MERGGAREPKAGRRELLAGAVLAAVLPGLAACGAGDRPPTSTALPDTVTYAEHVAPILYEECAPCHRSGGPAPFPLDRYAQARGYAPRIVELVESHTMPPWLPEPGGAPFAGERRLTERQIALVRRWVAQGAPRGNPADAPSPPERPGGWELGEPDLVLEMPEAYRVPARGRDVFRNFVLEIPVDSARWVEAVELRPGNPRVVHHATMRVDRTASSRRLDARDPGPGFDGMDAGGEARPPGGFFLGWTPGKVPRREPEGLAWPVRPGDDLVLQLHLRPRGRQERVKARIGLHFAERPPERAPYILRLGSRTLDIPPGEPAYAIDDAYTLPVGVRVLGVYPHAHYLGDTIRVRAVLPDGSERSLLRIDDWNFNWQDAYRYAEPVALPEGTEIRVRFTFDNTGSNPQNPHDPPRRVVYGPTSTDEMAELWLQVLPPDSAALATLARDFSAKELASHVAGWRHDLEVDPEDPAAHYGLGHHLQSRGRVEEAMEHYRAALAADSSYFHAHYNLAVALQARGELEAAVRHYRRTLDLFPAHADAHNNLGNALRSRGDLEGAIRHWRRAVEAEPRHALAHNNLGNALRATGRTDEAVGHFRRALEIDPSYAEAHYNLGATRMAEGRAREAVRSFRAAAEARPGWTPPLVAAAWLLAAHPDGDVRQPREAIRLARRAAEASDGEDPSALDVLAVALAAAGRFEEAVATARRAVERARERGSSRVLEVARRHLEMFERGVPYVQGESAPGG